MLRRRLCHLIWKISYGFSLAAGLLPAPIDWQQQPPQIRLTRFYQVYRCCMHCLWVLLAILTVWYFYPRGYMTVQPVLQWTYAITHASKVLATVILLKELWCQQKPIMQTYCSYWELRQRYHQIQVADVTSDIERWLVYKFVAAYCIWLMTGSVFLQMHPGRELQYHAITLISFLLNAVLQMITDQFSYALCHVYGQFACVNRSLEATLRELRDCQYAPQQLPLLAQRISLLAALHLDTFRLTQRIFAISEISVAAILFRMFTTNARIVYHAVLIIGGNFEADSWTLANELLLTVAFYCEAVLIVNVFDALFVACNDITLVLHQYGSVELELQLALQLEQYGQLGREAELEHILSDQHCIARALDKLALQLCCHKLQYNVCGLFEFSKEGSMRFFLLVLIKVTVLVQFHWQNK